MTDFWRGVLAVPAAALAALVVIGSIMLLTHCYWHWSGEYWFRRKPIAERRTEHSARLAANVFNARQVRTFRLFPGCLVMVVRDYAYHSAGVGDRYFSASNALMDLIDEED